MTLESGQPTIQVGGNNGYGWGNGGFDIGLLFLGLMMMGGWGGWGGRGGGGMPANAATTEDVNAATQFGQLLDQGRDINNNTNRDFGQLSQNMSDKYMELQRDIAALAVTQANIQAKQQECCCETLRAIDAVTLRTTEQFAAMQAEMVKQNQLTRDMITENQIQSLRDRVQNLEANERFQGLFARMNGLPFAG